MMNKQLCELEFKIENVDQILNMGGPWICSLYLGDTLISDNCIVDSFLEDDACQKIYFIKYHRISKWKADNFFTLNYISINDKAIYKSKRTFEMLYLKRFLDQENIEVFYAFHDKNKETRDVFTVSEQQFVCV